MVRVEIFSEKTRMTPASATQSSWSSRDCRAVEAPTDRGNSVQDEPGLRTAEGGTLRALASWERGESRQYGAEFATLPLPVRHDEPADALQAHGPAAAAASPALRPTEGAPR